MNAIQDVLSPDLLQAIGWTLLHSLWQVTLIAIVLAIVLIMMRRFSATTRYFVSVFMLFLVLATAVCSFMIFYQPKQTSITSVEKTTEKAVTNIALEAAINQEKEILPSYEKNITAHAPTYLVTMQSYFNQHIPLIVTIWLLGIAVLLLRFLGSLGYIQRLKHYKTLPFSDIWQEKAAALANQIGVQQKVQYVRSLMISTPMAIGCFRPFILIPAKLMTGLSDRQIEAILVHELAHIKRNDYAVNILQSILEILFFYHPLVWWLSAMVRNERENCCDDIAVNLIGEKIDYANTLILLKEHSIRPTIPALAFSGLKNSFSHRIKRLFNPPQLFGDFREGFVTAFILIGGLFLLGFSTPTALLEANNKTAASIEKSALGQEEAPTESTVVTEIIRESDEEDTSLNKLNKTSARADNLSQNPKQTKTKKTESPTLPTEFSMATNDEDLKLLLNAIEDGDYELVAYMIKKGTNINAATQKGWTPLMEAVDEGNIGIIKLLIEKNANVNASDRDGDTVLKVAMENGNYEVISYLIEKGADVKARNKKGESVLMEVIDEGHLNIVSLLIEKGADINLKTAYGTPLEEAIEEGNVAMVKLLIEKGADIHQPYRDGHTPLVKAIDEGNITIVRLLIEKGADFTKTIDDHHPFLIAINEGYKDIVLLMLEKGIDVNLETRKGNTPLLEAIDEGQTGIASLLIEKGADIRKVSKNGNTPLLEAIDEDNQTIIKILLEKGVDPNVSGQTNHPLLEAIDDGNMELVKLLLSNGAAINQETKDSDLPLMEAIDERHLGIAQLLIDKGANVNQISRDGNAPLLEAVDENYGPMVALLLENGANINASYGDNTALIEACDEGNMEITRLLLEKGANPNKAGENGYTALMESADEGRLEIAQLLLTNGAKIDAKTDEGWTALFEAVDEKHMELVRLFIEKGANVNQLYKGKNHTHIKNNRNVLIRIEEWTPLFEAIEEEATDIVEVLIEKGANMEQTLTKIIQDYREEETIIYKGWTPLMEAAFAGHLPTVQLLIKKGNDAKATTTEGVTAAEIAKRYGHPKITQYLDRL